MLNLFLNETLFYFCGRGISISFKFENILKLLLIDSQLRVCLAVVTKG